MKPIERRDLEALLAAAREETTPGLGELFTRYHNYIELLASTQVDGRLPVRCSETDVVRETLWEMQRSFPQFKGSGEGEFLAWLRQILACSLLRVEERDLSPQQRRPQAEQSAEELAARLEHSTTRLEAVLVDHDHAAARNLHRPDWGVVLADEMAQMPDDYSQILRLRHMHGMSFKEIAQRMGRSARLVRVLWVRAIVVLRERLKTRGVL